MEIVPHKRGGTYPKKVPPLSVVSHTGRALRAARRCPPGQPTRRPPTPGSRLRAPRTPVSATSEASTPGRRSRESATSCRQARSGSPFALRTSPRRSLLSPLGVFTPFSQRETKASATPTTRASARCTQPAAPRNSARIRGPPSRVTQRKPHEPPVHHLSFPEIRRSRPCGNTAGQSVHVGKLTGSPEPHPVFHRLRGNGYP